MSGIPAITSACGLPRHVDVLVVGGGPAGAMAAMTSARAGLRTLLVDRVSHPREKVCGCCLAPRGQAVLQAAGLADVLDGACRIRQVRLTCGDRAVRVPRRDTLVLSRSQMDTRLLHAAANAGVMLAWPFVASVEGDGLCRLQGPGGDRTVHARMRVVADGLQGGALRDNPRFAWRVRRASRMGLGGFLPAGAVDVEEGEIHMRVDRAGYVGMVRLPDGRIDVAAAIRPEALREHGSAANGIMALLRGALRDPAAVRAAAWHGTARLWRNRPHLHGTDTLIAGDAVGYVEPFTGEGMGWALATGAAAGAHAAAVLHGQASTQAWAARVRALTGQARMRCGVVACMLRHPWLVQGAIGSAAVLPGMAARVAASLGAAHDGGETPCRA
jgi:flavin-dependent dehydrogenase